jgi:hypothetical protein
MKNNDLTLMQEFINLTESKVDNKKADIKYGYIIGSYEAMLKLFASKGLTEEQKK